MRSREDCSLRTVGVIKKTEDDSRVWVNVVGLMRRRLDWWDVVLKCLAENGIKINVGTVNVMLNPLVRTKLDNL